jgi:hypothetical protein
VALSYVFAGVGGYYASKQGGLAGVFRCATDGTDWKHHWLGQPMVPQHLPVNEIAFQLVRSRR